MQLRSESGDLVVLGGEPGHRGVPEPLELADLTVPAGEPRAEIDDLSLEPVEALKTRVGLLPVVLGSIALTMELGSEVWVGAVERGSGMPASTQRIFTSHFRSFGKSPPSSCANAVRMRVSA